MINGIWQGNLTDTQTNSALNVITLYCQRQRHDHMDEISFGENNLIECRPTICYDMGFTPIIYVTAGNRLHVSRAI